MFFDHVLTLSILTLPGYKFIYILKNDRPKKGTSEQERTKRKEVNTDGRSNK